MEPAANRTGNWQEHWFENLLIRSGDGRLEGNALLAVASQPARMVTAGPVRKNPNVPNGPGAAVPARCPPARRGRLGAGRRPDYVRQRSRLGMRTAGGTSDHLPDRAISVCAFTIKCPRGCRRHEPVNPDRLAEPAVPAGDPARITTRSPAWWHRMDIIASSTSRTMASAESAGGTRNGSAPQVRASWLRTAGTGVKASSGSRGCRRASLRTVSPDWVKATSAVAPSPSRYHGRTARAGRPGSGRADAAAGPRRPADSTSATIRVMVRADSTGYLPMLVSPEHDRVGSVEHRVRDVGRLGPGGPGIDDHRLEHLGGHYDGLGVLPAQLGPCASAPRAPAPAGVRHRGRRGPP